METSKKEAKFNFTEEENNIYNQLDPSSQEYLLMRLEQEMLPIERERERLKKEMNEEILYMKQRLLYNTCGKIQEITDDPNEYEKLKKICPDLFIRFPTRGTKKRMRKKPKPQKLNAEFAAACEPLSQEEILSDLNFVKQEKQKPSSTTEGMSIMVTKSGQKWIVDKEILENGTIKVTYFDGTSSMISKNDYKMLDIHFDPINQ
ncbi:hypothetical protein GPJ56_010546 [Histomonas meleagridis]|uniref:uncharacterized protein n=1 Tax=Histomonas meleagridis TaxID=135588 RepID=UPI00355A587A|nr:hypothetical protein GPJ56_010546 [Histomonas meleagridis]KAH0797996.1 hypothetical protein GO595_009215 [Histomonas meleagridis]